MKNMQYKTIQPTTGLTVVVKNENEFKQIVKPNNKIAKIIMLYTNWSEQTFFTLAGRYCYGTAVQIGRTEVKSYRWPRPYIINASKEELNEVKHQQSVANNKTSYAFTEEVAYLLTKAYRKNPLNISLEYGNSYSWKEKKVIQHTDEHGIIRKSIKQTTKTVYQDKPEYFIRIADSRFPLTNDMQHFVKGVEKALAELEYNDIKATRATQRKVDILCRKYADGIDYNRHVAPNYVTYTYTKDVQKINPNTGLSYTIKEQHEASIETLQEVHTWKEGWRTTKYHDEKQTSTSVDVYSSDIRSYPAQDKLAEAEAVLNWLEEHEILDMHAYHCPKCGKVADTYSGCDYCGYELPEEAKSDFNNGRITAQELASMSVEAIEAIFTRNDTAVSYEEWQCKDVEDN